MKPKTLLSLFAAALAASQTAVSAQEQPPGEPQRESVKPAEPPPSGHPERREGRDGRPPPDRGPGGPERGRGGENRERSQRQQPELRPTAFIGVVTRELSPEVRSQTGLGEGFGLLVTEVMPDGPAQTAGLRQHDVLTKLDDQLLVNMEQLAALVRSHKKDDIVTITLKRGGAEQKVELKVGERMMPPLAEQERSWNFRLDTPFGGGEMRGYGPPGAPFRDLSNEWRERADQFQDKMREFQNRVQEWARGDRQGPMPQPPAFEGDGQRGGGGPPQERGGFRRPPQPEQERRPDGRPRPESEPRSENGQPRTEVRAEASAQTVSSGSVIRRDDSGEYSIRRENDQATFRVKLNDGTEKTWPINTEEERNAVPESYRHKLRELNSMLENRGGHQPAEAPKPAANAKPPGEPL